MHEGQLHETGLLLLEDDSKHGDANANANGTDYVKVSKGTNQEG